MATALGAVMAAVWIANWGMWTAAQWNTPASYAGDGLQILGWIRAAMEGDYHFLGMSFVTRLGAPFEANWNDYPMYEKPFCILLGWAARAIGHLPAANLGMLLVHSLATAAFYLACRGFRWCRWWSAVGAMVFGMQAYISLRGQDHLLLALVYPLPLGLSAIWRLHGSHRLGPGTNGRRWCVAVSFLMGISGPYYLNMYLQFLLLVMALHAIAQPRRTNLVTGAQAFAAAVTGFVLAHNGMFTLRALAGPNHAALVRKTSEAEIYALRPVELFIPSPHHRWDPFAAIGRYYREESAYLQPESLSGYLGILGGLALLVLIGISVRQLAANRARQTHLAFWLSGWVLLYSSVGGVNSALALAGIRVFRASNRYSIFIAAMVLFWLVGRLHRLRGRWPRSLQIVAGVLLTVLAAVDQLPRNSRPENAAKTVATLRADADFGELVENALPPDARVFQLPAADFPEGVSVLGMPAYDHLRPYFHTQRTRFSFGGNRGRMDAAWQFNVERLPPRELVAELGQLGFHALILHRRGFADHGDRLLAILQQLGLRPMAVATDHDLVLVPLPPPHPEPGLPNLNALPFLNFGSEWTRRDVSPDETLWISAGVSSLQLNPAIPQGQELTLEIELAAIEPVTVAGSFGGQVFFARRLAAKESLATRVTFTRPDPALDLVLSSIGTGADETKPGFAVRRLRMTWVPDQ